jgi:GTP-binding protein
MARPRDFKVMKLYTFYGMSRSEVNQVEAGDICGIAGLTDIGVGDTVCDPGHLEALPALRVDEPTLQMEFGTNSSPMRGQDGKFVTARVIEDRLFEETSAMFRSVTSVNPTTKPGSSPDGASFILAF